MNDPSFGPAAESIRKLLEDVAVLETRISSNPVLPPDQSGLGREVVSLCFRTGGHARVVASEALAQARALLELRNATMPAQPWVSMSLRLSAERVADLWGPQERANESAKELKIAAESLDKIGREVADELILRKQPANLHNKLASIREQFPKLIVGVSAAQEAGLSVESAKREVASARFVPLGPTTIVRGWQLVGAVLAILLGFSTLEWADVPSRGIRPEYNAVYRVHQGILAATIAEVRSAASAAAKLDSSGPEKGTGQQTTAVRSQPASTTTAATSDTSQRKKVAHLTRRARPDDSLAVLQHKADSVANRAQLVLQTAGLGASAASALAEMGRLADEARDSTCAARLVPLSARAAAYGEALRADAVAGASAASDARDQISRLDAAASLPQATRKALHRAIRTAESRLDSADSMAARLVEVSSSDSSCPTQVSSTASGPGPTGGGTTRRSTGIKARLAAAPPAAAAGFAGFGFLLMAWGLYQVLRFLWSALAPDIAPSIDVNKLLDRMGQSGTGMVARSLLPILALGKALLPVVALSGAAAATTIIRWQVEPKVELQTFIDSTHVVTIGLPAESLPPIVIPTDTTKPTDSLLTKLLDRTQRVLDTVDAIHERVTP